MADRERSIADASRAKDPINTYYRFQVKWFFRRLEELFDPTIPTYNVCRTGNLSRVRAEFSSKINSTYVVYQSHEGRIRCQRAKTWQKALPSGEKIIWLGICSTVIGCYIVFWINFCHLSIFWINFCFPCDQKDLGDLFLLARES